MKFNFTAELFFVGLRRLFFLAIVVAVLPAEAQTVFDKMNSTVTPTGAYSLRRVVNGATRAIEVRSWNGSTADIGFNGSGDLDVSALNTLTNSFTAPGPVTNPLDGLTASAGSGNGAIYSLRKMRSGYSGPAVDVINDSNVTLAIGFDGSGNLDVAALLTHVGSGSGQVSQWYDQSGNGYHLTNSDGSRYPSIAINGAVLMRNGRPTLNFSTSQNLQVDVTPPVSSAVTGNAVASLRNNGTYNRILSIYDQTNGSADFDNVYSVDLLSRVGDGSGGTDQAVGTYFNDGSASAAFGQTIPDYLDDNYSSYPASFVATAIIGSGNATTYVNGNAGTTGSTNGTLDLGTNGLVTIYIGSIFSFYGWDGNISEVTLFFQDIGSTDRQALEGSQLVYYKAANNGFVTKWYDQNGSNHLLQPTNVKQPQIVNNGSVSTLGGKVVLPFTGSESFEVALSIPGTVTNITGNAVGTLDASTAQQYARVLSFSGPSGGVDYDDATSVDLIGRNDVSSTLMTAFNNNSFNIGGSVGTSTFVASSVISSTNSTIITNGAVTTPQSVSGAAFTGTSYLTVGNEKVSDKVRQWGGTLSEVTLFVSSTALSIEDRWVLEANQASYYGLSGSTWGGAFLWDGGTSSTAANFLPNGGTLGGSNIVVPRNPSNGAMSFGGNLNIANWGMISGSSVTLNSPRSLTVTADIIGGGTLSGTGNLILNGSGTQTITSTTVSVNNLTINTGSNNVVNNGTFSVSGTLTLNGAAALDADGATGSFTLKSVSGADARVAQLTGSPISGNVTVEKFIPNSPGSRVYRYITPSVIGASVADWQGPAPTYGFPITGTFSDPSDNTAWPSLSTIISTSPSMYRYNETLSGLQVDRYEAYPTSGLASANSIENGRGYAAYIRNAADITIRAKGTLAQGNTSVNVNCHAGPGSEDGWNLIGNPYASAIDWANVELSTDNTEIDDAIYVRDNTNTLGLGTGVAAVYMQSNPGTSTFDGRLSAGQAFFVHANNTGQMTFREADKISATDVPFVRQATAQIPTLKLFIEGGSTKDQLAIHFPANAKDIRESRFDALKFKSDAALGNFYSLSSDDRSLAINGLTPLTPGQDKTVKIATEGLKAGNYTIKAGMLETFTTGDIKIELIDKFTGSKYTFDASHLTYSFSVTSETGSSATDRFTVKFAREQMITAVEEFSRQIITYPNPTKNIVYIEAPATASAEVKVISAMGATVGTVEMINQDGKLKGQFDLSERPIGVYLINLSQDGKITTKKIIKK